MKPGFVDLRYTIKSHKDGSTSDDTYYACNKHAAQDRLNGIRDTLADINNLLHTHEFELEDWSMCETTWFAPIVTSGRG